MKVLIAGSAAKEQALAAQMEKQGCHEVAVFPGNPGTVQFKQSQSEDCVIPDHASLEQAADLFDPDWIVICDERVAASAVPEQLKQKGWKVIAPDRELIRLLSNRQEFLHLMDHAQIPWPSSEVLVSAEQAAKRIPDLTYPIIFQQLSSAEFAIAYSEEEAEEIMNTWQKSADCKADTPVMIKSFINGVRFNMPLVCRNGAILPLRSVVIQRGVYEHEDDAQAKAMGAYCPGDVLIRSEAEEQAVADCIIPLQNAMMEAGIKADGFLSAELIDTGKEVFLINLKPGLSEAGSCSWMPLLKEDLLSLLLNPSMYDRELLHWYRGSGISTVFAANGYPERESHGTPIRFGDDLEAQVYCQHASICNGTMLTDGGRVLILSVTGSTHASALQRMQEQIESIQCQDLFCRKDIGMSQYK